MSNRAASEMLHGYLDALVSRGDFARYFADDVTFEIVGTPQSAHGRDAVRDMILYLHTQAFDGTVKAKAVFVADGHAAVECDFVATHTAEFLGIAATGRSVNVPYAVVYDLGDTEIYALRIYMSMELIKQQLQ
jgi:predicted ester cyclase